jgi:hypothetical protein
MTISYAFQKWISLADIELPVDPQARLRFMNAMARAFVAGYRKAEDDNYDR